MRWWLSVKMLVLCTATFSTIDGENFVCMFPVDFICFMLKRINTSPKGSKSTSLYSVGSKNFAKFLLSVTPDR
jgi:hypothetical protein